MTDGFRWNLGRVSFVRCSSDGHACERIADIMEGKEYMPWEPML